MLQPAAHRICYDRTVPVPVHCNCEREPSRCFSCIGYAELNSELIDTAILTQITFGWVLLYFEWFSIDCEIRLALILQVRLEYLLPVGRFSQEYVL